MPKKMTDQFANKAYCGVTQSAVDTLTFSQIQTGVSVFERVAWVIHRIRYIPAQTNWFQLDTESDFFDMAITLSDNLDDLNQSQSAVLDVCPMITITAGTPADIIRREQHIDHDFSTMPGGGLIIPGSSVFIGLDSSGGASVMSGNAIVYFSYKQMADADYIELVQALNMIR